VTRIVTPRVWLAALAAFALGGLLPALAVSGKTIEVRMKDLVFGPAEVHAHVGDMIEWINDDILVHTATARSGAWDFNLPRGSKQRLALNKTGSFDYFCRLHPNMKGRIVVEAN
jgi:plastocyanin